MSQAANDVVDRDGQRPRAWQRMLSGRRLDLLNPSPADIDIEDIAHGLARVARWNGQTVGTHAFSVAQHSVLVADICDALASDLTPQWRLAALLHDAAEYVVGDLISPFKTAIGRDYKSFELRLSASIHAAFGVPDPMPDAIAATIKHADGIAAYYEATRLAGFTEPEAALYFPLAGDTLPSALRLEMDVLTAHETQAAQAAFLERFALLKTSVS
ncbi:MAG: HD family hydrolase [Pseudomonadota bacterium]